MRTKLEYEDGRPARIVGVSMDITERKRAEESANKAMALFEDAERIASLGSWEMDPETEQFYCSDETCRLYGLPFGKAFYTRAETRAAIHPDDREIAESAYRTLMEGGGPVEIEYRLKQPNGKLKHVQMRARLQQEANRPGRIIGVSMDITERKLAHEALRESQNKYQSLTEAAPVGIFQTDEKVGCIYVNERWTELAGMTLEQARGEGWTDSLHPDDRDRVIAEANYAVSTGQPFASEYRYRRPDGEITWVYGQAVAQLSATGKALGYIGTITDITDRKNGEAYVRKINTLLEEAENLAGLGGWELDLDTGRIQCSEEARRLYELSPDKEYFSRDEFRRSLHPDDRDLLQKAYETLIERGEPLAVEYRLLPGGVLKHIQVRARLEREDGRPKRVVGVSMDITERKLAEEALRKTERELQTITDHIPALISYVDADERYRFVNKAYEFIYDLPREDILGKRVREVLPPDIYDVAKPHLARVLEGRPTSFEGWFCLPNGERRYARAQLAPNLGTDQQVRGYYTLITDITDLKQVESELEKSNEQLQVAEKRVRMLLESSPDGILVADADGSITLVNARMEEMFGYERTELIGQPIEMLMPEGSRDRHRVDRKSYSDAPRARPMGAARSLFGLRKDGSELPVEISLSPVEMGEETVTMATIRDVTEIREAIDARLQLASIVDASTDAIVQAGVDGKIVAWNAGAETMFGYSSDESVGMPVTILLPPELSHERDVILDRLSRGESAEIPETVRVGKDGRRVDVSVSIFSLRDSSGKVTSTVGIARDIGPHKEMERQFREAQRMEAIGKLAGGIAHDFNNILTVITGYASLIKDKVAHDAGLKQNLEAQSRATERGAILTRELLAFSRKQRFEPQVLDINGIVAQLRKVLLHSLAEDIDLVTVLGSKGHIEADPAQLEQVIVNLVVNARHAMPQGGHLKLETADVRLGEKETAILGNIEPGPYVRLSVTDNGSGIDADTLPHIFEPFFTTKEKGEGTGLGLSAVYGIVKQSGGAIEVESEPGCGTVFRIYFRRTELSRDESAESDGTREDCRGDATILLLEDDEDVRSLAAEVLGKSGYTIIEVGTVAEAREALGVERSIDLVLTDVVMPGMSGPEFVEWARATDPGMRVLYMSGYTGEALAARPLGKGSHLLQKPFSPAALLRKVGQVVRGQ